MVTSICKSYVKTLMTHIDGVLLCVIIGALNVHLLGNGPFYSLIFMPDAVLDGQWWRLFTHPFVHVSWYHFLLDGTAFFLLYYQLQGKRLKRLIHVALCASCSLGVALICSPDIQTLGLCGLSGVAHGLMAVVSLDMIRSKTHHTLGLVCLSAVIAKSLIETISGGVLFSSLHAGLCGTPLVSCHLGGVMGGLISYFMLFHYSVSQPQDIGQSHENHTD